MMTFLQECGILNETPVRERLRTSPDHDTIEETKQKLIKTFEALPDYIATEVFAELKERSIL